MKKAKAKIKKVIKGLKKASKTHAKQADDLEKAMKEESNPRIPRKKGQPANSKKHSDLYTDENPRDTVKIKFATPADARATVAKVKRVSKPFARKIQILTVMEQRAKVMGKSQVASIAKKGKDAIRKRHKKTS